MDLDEQLKRQYRAFEIQTKKIYIDMFPNGIETLKQHLEEWEGLKCAIGGKHWLDKDKDNPEQEVDGHYHIYCVMKNPTKMSTILSQINGFTVNADNYELPSLENKGGLKIGIPQIEKVKGKIKDCYKYLYHQDEKSLNDENKHKYTVEEMQPYLFTIRTTEEEMSESEESNYKSRDDEFRTICDLIDSGELTEYNILEREDLVSSFNYARYKSQIKAIFERKAIQKQKKVMKEGYNMQVIYMQGESGSGKTTFAKQWADDREMSYFISGSSNDPFDGYAGEEVIILDDYRGTVFKFSDLLKILDNNTSTAVQRRYYNAVVTCKYLIITTVVPIEKLYSFFKNSDEAEQYKEPLKQLKRRCKYYFQFTENTITMLMYNKNKDFYEKIGKMPNPITIKYKEDEMSEEEKLNAVAELLGGFGEGLVSVAQFVKDNPDLAYDDVDEDANGFQHVDSEELPFQ